MYTSPYRLGNIRPVRPDHVAIYIRWSTDDQANGTTLQVQREGCLAYCRLKGWQVDESRVFVDDGYSGSTLDRPAMTEMRYLIQQGEIDCVVVLRLDRLSRSIVDAVDLALAEWEGKCQVRSVHENFETGTTQGQMQFVMLASMAELERVNIRDRTLSGKLRRLQEGRINISRPPFGYRHSTEKRGYWEPDPGQAPVVEQIFHLAAEGMSAARITRYLNRKGICSNKHKPFTLSSVQYILGNPIYAGFLTFGRRIVKKESLRLEERRVDGLLRIKRHNVKFIKRETPLISGVRALKAPALVTQELWDAAQGALRTTTLARRTVGNRALNGRYLLSGLLACPCGAAMIHHSPSAKYHYYVCSRSRTPGGCSFGTRVPVAVADEMVESAFLQAHGIPAIRQAHFDARIQALNADLAAAKAAYTAAVSERDRLKAQIQELVSQVIAGAASAAEAAEYEALFAEHLADAEQRIQTAQRAYVAVYQRVVELKAVYADLTPVDSWYTLDVPRKRALLVRAAHERIVVHQLPGGEFQVDCPWLLTHDPRTRTTDLSRETAEPALVSACEGV